MELDQLKDHWRVLDDPPPLRGDLPTLLERAERSAAGPLRSMKRNVLRQAVSLVVVYVLAFTQFHGPERIPIGIFYALMMLAGGVYYVIKYRLLNSMEHIPADEDMVTNFTNKLESLRGLLRLNLYLTYILLLIVLWFVCWVLWAYRQSDFYSFAGIHLHRGQEAIVIGGWTVAAFILMIPGHYATRWFNYRRYGRYVETLEKTLEELQSGQ